MQFGYGAKFLPAAAATRSIDGIAAATTTSAICGLALVNLACTESRPSSALKHADTFAATNERVR